MKRLLLNLIAVIFLSSFVYAGEADDPLLYKFTATEFEIQDDSHKTINWDVNFWLGKDLEKIYFYSEGSLEDSDIDESETSLVYSTALSSFWDYQIGWAYDKNQNENQHWFVAGLQGLAPYFIETRVNLLVKSRKTIGLRAEIDYDILFTQKLMLTPSFQTALYTKNNEKIKLGSGLSYTNFALRLKYEVYREFAPYLGIVWSKNYGNTDKFDSLDEVNFVAGLRFWF